jgi:hypothetical protein
MKESGTSFSKNGNKDLSRPLFSAALLTGVMALSWTSIALAQSVYGRINGTVRDSRGEPVVGATLISTSEEKGTQLRAKTDARGHYEFPQLQPDTYDVRLEPSGVGTDTSVSADEESLVDLKLPAQGQAGPAPSASTLRTRADVSVALDRNALANLPNFDQNSTRFGFLAPGTHLRGGDALSANNPENSLQLSINGQPPSGTALQLDGTDNRDPINQLAVINASLESLAEIKITTQSFDAESGQALSGVVTAQTRSGGNAWHGSALEFRRSSWADASNPNLQNPSRVASPFFRVNLFGGSLGGPILKNKLFIFGDYQGTRRSLGSTEVLNVPSALVRSTCLNPTIPFCDLSEYLPPAPSGSNSSSPFIYDPITSNKFLKIPNCGNAPGGYALDQDGYCISKAPSSGNSFLSQQAVNLLSLLPAPNILGAWVSNYRVSGAEAWDEDNYTFRVDNNLTKKLQVFGRYTFATYRINSPSAFGNLVGGPGFGPDTFAGTARSPNHSLSTGFDYAFRPGLYTDFRFGFFRRKISVLPNSYNTTPANNAGIFGLNLGDALSSGMPSILIQQPTTLQSVSSAINFGDGRVANQCRCPLFETVEQFQWVNNWVQSHGNHLFKWGEDFRVAQDLAILSTSHRSGELTFAQKDTASAGQGGLGLATLLIGDVSGFTRTVGNTSSAGPRQRRLFFYGQDTWRIGPRLTLSYGLRWEIYFPQSQNARGAGGFLNLNTGMIGVAGYPCCALDGGVENSWRNLAPRVGIAYQLDNRTVLRVAYGRNFDSGQTFARGVSLNPPEAWNEIASPPPPPANQNSVFNLQCTSAGSSQNPCLPSIPSVSISPGGEFKLQKGIMAATVPRHQLVPTLDQWNLSIQHELASNLSMGIAYVGNKATHVQASDSNGNVTSINLNQQTITGFAAGCFSSPQSTPCLKRYPLYQFEWTQPITLDGGVWTQPITLNGGVASANYNALQAKVVKRFSQGYEFNANYTWAKGIGYQGDYFNQDPGLNRGVNVFDRTHTFVLYNVLELPIGKGKSLLGDLSGTANYFVGGWSVNTITTWASGLPFSPTYNLTECLQDRDTGPCRPNLVGAVHITGDRNNYFTTTGGKPLNSNGDPIGPWQRPAVGTFGTAGFNSLRGPSFFDTDLVVAKNIVFSERYSVQFRADFRNVFNKVNLGNPSGCVDCKNANNAQTGAIIGTLAPNASQRQIEFSLRFQF